MEHWKILRKSFLTGVFFALGIITTAIVAVTVSATFTSGNTLTAAQMNVVKTAIESIPDWTKSGSDAVFSGGGAAINTGTMVANSKLTVNGRISSSTLGTFCGFTASGYDGAQVGGYTGAKSKCETACGNTSAHMCTAHEVMISLQLGISMAGSGGFGAFYMSGIKATSVNAPNPIRDCSDWTSNSASDYGGGIDNAGSLVVNRNCGTTAKLACCL